MSNNSIKVIGGAGVSTVNPEFQLFTLTAPQIAAKQVVLSSDAVDESVHIQIEGGGDQIKTLSWTFIAPNIVSWNGLSLDGVLIVGNNLAVTYIEA